MDTRSRARRFVLAVLAVGVTAVGVGVAVAPAQTGQAAAAKRITSAGVGAVKIGRTFQQLRADGLVGRIRKGCELAPNTRSARLLAPLAGNVNFTQSTPRKVTDITVRGGARARGVGVGAKIPAIKAAFPKAKVDHSTDSVFGITLVKIPKNGGGRIQFAVSTTTKRTTLIGVPFIAFCE
jgi:hypothetical protein